MLSPEIVAGFVADAIRAEWEAGKKKRKTRKKQTGPDFFGTPRPNLFHREKRM